jgi:chromosome segregation ATPase
VATLEEIEARVAALEQQVQAVRQDAAAARVLAGGADRDVSALATRLDAQTKLLMALRETQIEQGDRLTGLENEVRQGFGSMATGQAEISALLHRLLPGDDE